MKRDNKMKLDLKKGERICFLGDSITAHGWWIEEICEYFLNNYKDKQIGLYNCGIPGTCGRDVDRKDRLYMDCFNLFPKYVVVMFGMNDSYVFLYDPECEQENKVEEREGYLAGYENTLEHIIAECERNHAIPILCTPTPYDEYTVSEDKNFFADCALSYCAETVKKVAKKHNLMVVDFRKILIDEIAKQPVGEDRIHPNKFGHHLMAECFLNTIGAKDTVDIEGTVEFSEKNRARFEVEQINRSFMFLELDGMGWQRVESKPLEERKEILKDKLKELEDPWFIEQIDNYLRYVDYREEVKGAIVKKTIEMYE